MIPHELVPPRQHESDLAPVVAAQEVEESRQMSYNPDAVGTLTAEQDSAIEDMANEALSNGTPSDEVQKMVYDKLTELGFDLSGAQNNALVVNYEGIDGKPGVLRAITLRPDDFGVVIRNAELVAAGPQVEEVGVEALDPQETELLQEVANDVSYLEGDLEASMKSGTELGKKAHHIMGVIRTEFIDKLTNHLPINNALIHSTKVQAEQLLTLLEAQRDGVQEQVAHAIDPSGERFGKDESSSSDTLETDIKVLVGMFDANRRNQALAMQSAYSSHEMLTTILKQLETGQPVPELLNRLSLSVSKVESAVGGSVSRDRDAKNLLNKLKERLSQSR